MNSSIKFSGCNCEIQLEIESNNFFCVCFNYMCLVFFLVLLSKQKTSKKTSDSLLPLLKEYEFLVAGAPPKQVQFCLISLQYIFLLILDNSSNHRNIVLWVWLYMLALAIQIWKIMSNPWCKTGILKVESKSQNWFSS